MMNLLRIIYNYQRKQIRRLQVSNARLRSENKDLKRELSQYKEYY